ncbi:hypothetical protein Tco_0008011 [Tanacetum coccineum]
MVYNVIKAHMDFLKHQDFGSNPFYFLLKQGYRRGTIDKTLFLKKHKRDIILVQVYVDDIIFGSIKKAWNQVTSTTSNLESVKKDIPDRKSTTGGCSVYPDLGRGLIHACKKQTIKATSSTTAEYVRLLTLKCQVLWIQSVD